MESHCAEGLTESQAQARALTDLGDAKTAAKSFRKSYLTAAEAKAVERAVNRCRSVSYQCYSNGILLLGFGAGFYSLKQRHAPLIGPGVLAIMILTFQSLCLWLARRPISRFRVRLLFSLEMLIWMSILMLADWYFRWGFVALIFASMSKMQASRFRLWFKIQRADDFGREIPPPSATVKGVKP